MAQRPKIVGYGICGPNEPYLEATLKEFERLCDETIICLNNVTEKEKNLIESYGFKTVVDNSEWGVNQWKIKEDFVTNHVSKLQPDLCVCLDADEVFDKNLTREGLYHLYQSEFKSFYFYIVNLWDEGYLPELCFWNIRVWKWNGTTKFPHKNLHCGLAPEWVWYQGFYAPYLLKHYGLQDAQRRLQKASRYDKYDPNGKWLSLQKDYYKTLRSSPQVKEFNEDKLHQEVVDYTQTYKQQFNKRNMIEEELVYIKTLGGETAAVPKAKLQKYLKQGCEYVGDIKELDDKLDAILDEEPLTNLPPAVQDEKEEIFICGDCSKQFDSGKALHGHKLGAHKKTWSWGRK